MPDSSTDRGTANLRSARRMWLRRRCSTRFTKFWSSNQISLRPAPECLCRFSCVARPGETARHRWLRFQGRLTKW